MQPNARQNNSTNMFVNEIRQRIDAYLKIVIRNVRDTVPKITGNYLVRGGQDAL